MTQITNKKELLAALSEWVPGRIGADGSLRIASIFEGVDHDRAMEIIKEINDNLRDEFNRHPPVDLTPQDFMRIAARNVDLNSQTEILTFVYHVGIIWEKVFTRITAMNQPPPGSILPSQN